MSNRIVQIIRDPVSGAGVNGQTMDIKKVVDDSLVSTGTSDSSGRGIFSVSSIGNPGPIYAEFDDGTNIKKHSGEVTGQLGGFLWADAINDALQAMGSGVVVAGHTNELAVSANGANMILSVATGAAVLKDGYAFVLESTANVTVGTADATLPRIDRVILRVVRESQSNRGSVSLSILAGTPASTPAAPALTQDSTSWDISLAQVYVDPAVTSIAVGKVTDERSFTFTPPSGITPGDILYVTASGKIARLPVGATNEVLTVASGLPSWGARSNGITRTAFDDTSRLTTSTSVYTDQVSLSMDLDLPGTWAIEAVAMARMLHSADGNIDVRITVDGTTTTVTRSADSVIGTPIHIRGFKSGMTTSPKVITLAFRANDAGTARMSNAALICTAYRV